MASTQYVGKAGHLAVMGEFCLRGYNAAMPEIDKGDDVFIVNDATGAMWRIQVKTARGQKRTTSRTYQFRVRESAIMTAQTPELHFAFVMRKDMVWHFLIMDRPVLRTYVRNNRMGTAAGDYRQFTITLHDDGQVICSKINLSNHLEDWATWPWL